MCGICGKLVLSRDPAEIDPAILKRMAATLSHRGPDGQGFYCSGGIALAHTRLSIIDLSTGQQPLSNEDGSVWVAFNGEIYNYKELTSLLVSKGHRFRTVSDTEVIVHLYEELGEGCVEKLSGMFSFALWDEKTRTLLLARDRVGIKPLYYCLTENALVFGSEVKAILADPSVHVKVDPAALDKFLTFFYVPGTATIFDGIHRLEPGHYLLVKNGQVKVAQYWDVLFPKGSERTRTEYVKELTDLLAASVRDHMISDVPVGVLLSGGVDSTSVLSFAVEHSTKRLSTYTIGFQEPGCTDERPYAKLAAETFGTEHYEATVTAKDFLECIPKYVWHMEEPVCEPPGIALYYITKLARSHVKVLLSGEGGDEAFAGYQNYRNLFWLEVLKQTLGPSARLVSRATGLLSHVGPLKRLKKYAPLMAMPFENYYYSRSSGPLEFFNRNKAAMYTKEFRALLPPKDGRELSDELLARVEGLDYLDRMLYIDTKTWLPDDLLIKADKMTMANAVELRVPLLDPRVLEFAAALPRSFKLRRSITKYILKEALSKRVPKPIVNRKKTGFPVPYRSWLLRELKEPVREILLDHQTLGRGYFQAQFIESLLNGNSAREDRSKEIFSLVVLELWHRVFADPHPPAAWQGCPAGQQTEVVRPGIGSKGVLWRSLSP
jgi:asparagine synthase (glutamine-hydrolysing)